MPRRKSCAAFLLVAGFCLPTCRAGAQSPVAPPDRLNPGPASGPAAPAAAELFATPPEAEESGPRWGADVLVGVPTGVRVQRFLAPDESQGLVLEGVAGLYALFPGAGVGVRWRWTPIWGDSDGLIISPGLDACALVDVTRGWITGGERSTFGLLCADVDVVWRHRWGRWGCGELGFELGASPTTVARPPIFPVASLFTGIRF